MSREVVVAAAMRIGEPAYQEHGPLQHETVGMARLTEPVEQPLESEPGQHQVKALVARLGDPQESRADRGANILDLLSHWR